MNRRRISVIAQTAAAGVVVALLAGVFSVRGLLYTFGLGSADGLAAPALTRVVTLLLVGELAALAGMAFDYRDGRRHLEWRWAWAVAHGTVCRRLYRRGRWLGRVLLRRLADGAEDYLLPAGRWLLAVAAARRAALRDQLAAGGAVEPPGAERPADALPEPVVLALVPAADRPDRQAG